MHQRGYFLLAPIMSKPSLFKQKRICIYLFKLQSITLIKIQ